MIIKEMHRMYGNIYHTIFCNVTIVVLDLGMGTSLALENLEK